MSKMEQKRAVESQGDSLRRRARISSITMVVLGGGAALMLGAYAFGKIPYFTDFEEIESGPMFSAEGWQTLRGVAELLDDTELAVEGEQALWLRGSDPGAVVERELRSDEPIDVAYLDYYLRPSTAETLRDSTRVSLGSASLAFVRDEESAAALWAFDAFSDDGAWVDIGLSLPVDLAGATEAAHRVTLRLDAGLGVYDIYLDGRMVEHDIGLAGEVDQELVFRFTGGAYGDSIVDDFYAGDINPLFEENEQADGVPTEWREANGYEGIGRYEEVGNDGELLIQKYFAEQRPDYAKSDENLGGDSIAEEKRPSLVVFTPLRPRMQDRYPELDWER